MKYRTIETQIPWKYKWKARDKDGIIAVYTEEPEKLYEWNRWDTCIGDFIEIGNGRAGRRPRSGHVIGG